MHAFIISAQISPGSKASMVDLSPGDIILAIDGIPTSNMMHCEAQNRMKQAARQLSLTVQRSEVMTERTTLGHVVGVGVGGGQSSGPTVSFLLQARNQTVVTPSERRRQSASV